MRAVASVLAQGIENIEVLVVDDSSAVPPDPELPPFRDPRVRVIRRSENGGAAAARNTGMAAAAGHWLTFLDSDDWLLPDTLATRLALAERTEATLPGPCAHVCGFVDVGPDGVGRRARIPREAEGAEGFAAGCWFSPGSCLIIRRQTALAVGPQEPALRRLEDLEWFLRFGLVGGRLATQNLLGAGITVGRPSPSAAVASAARWMSETWLRGPRADALSPRSRRRLAAYLALVQGAAALAEHRRLAGAAHLSRSLLLAPRLTAQVGPGWRTVPSRVASWPVSPVPGFPTTRAEPDNPDSVLGTEVRAKPR